MRDANDMKWNHRKNNENGKHEIELRVCVRITVQYRHNVSYTTFSTEMKSCIRRTKYINCTHLLLCDPCYHCDFQVDRKQEGRTLRGVRKRRPLFWYFVLSVISVLPWTIVSLTALEKAYVRRDAPTPFFTSFQSTYETLQKTYFSTKTISYNTPFKWFIIFDICSWIYCFL